MSFSPLVLIAAAIASFLTGFLSQRIKVAKANKKVKEAETVMLKSDSNYLELLKENKNLKEALNQKESKIISLQQPKTKQA